MASLVVMIQKRKVIKAKYRWDCLKSFATSSYIDITLEISGVRKFKNVTLAVNVDNECSYAVFNKSEIFFASTNHGFQTPHFFSFVQKNS